MRPGLRAVSGFDGDAFLAALPWTIGAVVVVLAAAFAASRLVGRVNVVDTAWGLCFVAVALVAFACSDGHGDTARRRLLLVLPVVWGIRLAVHLGRRAAGRGEDPRYAELIAGRGPLFVLAAVFGLQGALALLVSAPLQVGAYERGGLTPVAWAGVVVWVVGLTFEAVGDAQKTRFLADPANRGAILDRGLWRYTRHPNYFGDACVWVGIFLVAADRWPGVLTAASPIVMVYLLAFGSGKRVTERRMAGRAGWSEYARRTSGFLPLPPRRG